MTPASSVPVADELAGLTRERLEGWGMVQGGVSAVLRPRDIAGLRDAFHRAREAGVSLGLRGAGCSYGDACINHGGLVLELGRMNRILSFDEETGILVAEPGVTIEQVWRRALPCGWWPAVVPGTMFPTLGGCAAMNIHGKNNFRDGTIGRHITSFDLLLPDGSMRTCSREQDSELFHAAIGGFGMLGCFTSLTLQLAKVHSGDLLVKPVACRSVEEMIGFFEAQWRTSDYLVGWIDALGGGRGLIHQAWYLKEGEDPDPVSTLCARHQELPSRLLLVVPRSWMWWALWCLFHRPGMRLVNALKYRLGCRHARGTPYRQSLVGFSFLLDYVPRWKYAYKPGGLIQYQAFVPGKHAARVFNEQLRLSREHGAGPFLGVLKRHVSDPFLMTHAVDGYSLALDFPVTRRNRERTWRLAAAMDRVVLDAGGRFYVAKDSTMTPEAMRRAYPEANLRRFLELKRRLDPGNLLQTDLFRRVLQKLM